MKINELPKTGKKGLKRIGRGYGSGKGGHTVGRGSKGQKSRDQIHFFFEGTKIKKSLLKRLPLMRGKGKFHASRAQVVIINTKYLNLLSNGSEVTLKTLSEKGLIVLDKGEVINVKILGEGKLEKALTVKLPCSKGAKKLIEAAGGKVVMEEKSTKK